MQEEDKSYFFEMVESVRNKLSNLPAESLIKKHFPDSRLEEITKKIRETDCKDLEWGYWQPFFLFLQRADASAIESFECDLQSVAARPSSNTTKLFEFLDDKREVETSWRGGLFEIFIKAALLHNRKLSVEAFDWNTSNGRNVDAKVRLGQRIFCVECTTLGDSDADKKRWQAHSKRLKQEPVAAYCESQDAYTQGRRIYDKVYEKIARGFAPNASQLCPNAPNLLLIGLFPGLGDLRSSAPLIGCALDEMFSSQSNGNKSALSLTEYLQRHLNGKNGALTELLAALRTVSGILLFDGCKFGYAGINYNADKVCRITHAEMALFETVFAQSPAYD